MKRTILAISASIFAMTAMPAWAQDAAEEDAADSGDIIVTATRSETLLSKTPIADVRDHRRRLASNRASRTRPSLRYRSQPFDRAQQRPADHNSRRYQHRRH